MLGSLSPCQKATVNQLWEKWEKDAESKGEQLPDYAPRLFNHTIGFSHLSSLQFVKAFVQNRSQLSAGKNPLLSLL